MLNTCPEGICMSQGSILIFTATYNEIGNIERFCSEIFKIPDFDLKLLVIDDNSPDGTGKILDKIAARDNRLHVIHRPKKMGVGSAHKEAIAWAYQNGFNTLVTMDADFTHNPKFIPKLLEAGKQADIAITSRHRNDESLENWSIFRKLMTKGGYLLTKLLLNLPYDATGSFRCYNLKNINENIFSLIRGEKYSFFFESLLLLHHHEYSINEIPIVLPSRAAGSSKMTVKDVVNSILWIVSLSFRRLSWKRNKVLMRGKAVGN